MAWAHFLVYYVVPACSHDHDRRPPLPQEDNDPLMCPRCRTEVRGDDDFCPQCGELFTEGVPCGQHGNEPATV